MPKTAIVEVKTDRGGDREDVGGGGRQGPVTGWPENGHNVIEIPPELMTLLTAIAAMVRIGAGFKISSSMRGNCLGH